MLPPSLLEAPSSLPRASNWRDKRVLVTGHTGFKGSWLAMLLHRLGARVAGFALPPDTEPSLYREADVRGLVAWERLGDLQDTATLNALFVEARPEVVFHLAAQPIVVRSFESPRETFMTNVLGTLNVLEACRTVGTVRQAVIVTSDKCYQNDGSLWQFRETDSLGGSDPYSASKACAEIIARSFAESFLIAAGTAVHTVRAGNIVGGGDWAPHRIVPDIVRAVFRRQPLVVRMPGAVRPWQHVVDALLGYVLVAERMFESEGPNFDSWNFGPDYDGYVSVGDLLSQTKSVFPNLAWKLEPMCGVKEARALGLDSSKARRVLKWRPRVPSDGVVLRSLRWYESFYAAGGARELCFSEIDAFLSTHGPP